MATSRTILSRDAYLDLSRAHEHLAGQFTALFKAHGLSQAQYNALRILRGAGPDGASCATIAERLIHRVPDVTRLVDRLETAGLVTRERSSEDRRVVQVKLTAEGRGACEELQEPTLALHREQLAHVKVEDLKTLSRILRELTG